MNYSDSERIASVLEAIGFKPALKQEEADLIVVNTCSVRQSAEDRVYGKAKVWKKLKVTKVTDVTKVTEGSPRIILTGCAAERKDVKQKLKGIIDLFLNIKDLPDWPKKIKSLGFKIKDLKVKRDYLSVLPSCESDFQAFVPIMTGCENFCSYCIVPYARGKEVSRSMKEVVDEVKCLVDKGYKEITLLGQNVNSYKAEKVTEDSDFVKLLKKINNIPGKFWIRFVSPHPKDMGDDLIDAIANLNKVCEHVHLPVQGGDDAILKKMNRKYTVKKYLSLVAKARKKIKGCALTTDIIVGFPSETKKQFEGSKKLFKKAKFDLAYISQFSPRPGTAAAKMKDSVSSKEKHRREHELTAILAKTALENNKKYLDKSVEILVDSKARAKYPGILVGKTKTYKNVRFKGSDKLIGKFVKVKVVKVEAWGLEGVQNAKSQNPNDK